MPLLSHESSVSSVQRILYTTKLTLLFLFENLVCLHSGRWSHACIYFPADSIIVSINNDIEYICYIYRFLLILVTYCIHFLCFNYCDDDCIFGLPLKNIHVFILHVLCVIDISVLSLLSAALMILWR